MRYITVEPITIGQIGPLLEMSYLCIRSYTVESFITVRFHNERKEKEVS